MKKVSWLDQKRVFCFDQKKNSVFAKKLQHLNQLFEGQIFIGFTQVFAMLETDVSTSYTSNFKFVQSLEDT